MNATSHQAQDDTVGPHTTSFGGVMRITRPEPDEYAPYYGAYVNEVVGDDALTALKQQCDSTASFLAGLPETRAGHRYAPAKWSLREVVGHLADAERVFTDRMLRFARNDQTALPGFDENAYVPEGRFEQRALANVAREFSAVRESTLALVQSLDAETMLRRGTANGKVMSVRALAWVIAGHELHHLRVIRERYLA